LWLAIPRWRTGVSAQGYAFAALLPLLVSPHLHTQSLSLLAIPAALALRAQFESAGGRDEDEERRATSMLFAGHVLVFACWLSTALGFAPYALVTIGAFAAAAVKWPGREAGEGALQLRDAA
jgi:hypothetical protein